MLQMTHICENKTDLPKMQLSDLAKNLKHGIQKGIHKTPKPKEFFSSSSISSVVN